MQLRVHGPAQGERLIYLPGVHGDWTLIGSFARAVSDSVQLIQVTYPRSLSWSLSDYATHVEQRLAQEKVESGWLLGESFGSQVVWAILSAGRFQAKGVILAGGFAQYPFPFMAALAAWLTGRASFKLLRLAFRGYVVASRARFRRSPETLTGLNEFLARRTQIDCLALRHRLDLVARNDPRAMARSAALPVYALTGFWDPIVPWPPAARWLKRNCPGFRGHKVLWQADHNVLGTAPRAAAAQIQKWILTQPKNGPDTQGETTAGC